MRIGVLGGGQVGQTLGGALRAKGHEVTLGIRDPSAEGELQRPRQGARPLGEWRDATGAAVAPLAEAAAGAELVINATSGAGSLEALGLAGAGNLAGKPLLDVSNPLDFSRGMPPFLLAEFTGPTSLAERIQAAAPEARVAKAFNTVTAAVMVDPGLVPGEHDLFLSGEEGAKEAAREIARGFGWRRFADLGDLVGARAQELFVVAWVRLWQVGGDPNFGWRVVRA